MKEDIIVSEDGKVTHFCKQCHRILCDRHAEDHQHYNYLVKEEPKCADCYQEQKVEHHKE